ncbi:hypothetical protein EYC84_004395 [Monilinia fructicola]|uniref:DNA-directed DNA polymerase n=1 Tax=Monilinia fructicola TaxID=38448 RepID=A0A5M9K071_MONFR|nr:hypothetical protein EYC84_004395 [Monilinia fructicola]
MAIPVEDGSLLHAPTTSHSAPPTRVPSSYKPLSTFALSKAKHYQQQYGDIAAWDGFQISGETVRKVERVLDVRQGELCWVAGTIYMNMPLKPNILEDISKDHWISAPPPRRKYLSDNGEDEIMLEDESGRLRLIGSQLNTELLVPDLPPQEPRWEISGGNEEEDVDMDADKAGRKKIALISGLSFSGTSAENSLEKALLTEYLLGESLDPASQSNVSKISRLIIAGNSIASDLDSIAHDTVGNTRKAQKKYGYDASSYNPAPHCAF